MIHRKAIMVATKRVTDGDKGGSHVTINACQHQQRSTKTTKMKNGPKKRLTKNNNDGKKKESTTTRINNNKGDVTSLVTLTLVTTVIASFPATTTATSVEHTEYDGFRRHCTLIGSPT